MVVTYVERNSPAALAGVVRGDRVVTIDGLTEQALGYDRFITAVYPPMTHPATVLCLKIAGVRCRRKTLNRRGNTG